MSEYKDLCLSPQDLISTPPAGPNFSTAKGVFNGTPDYPKGPVSLINPKIEDGAVGSASPMDETRNFKA